MDVRRQFELLQRAEYLCCAWSRGHQRCLVLAENIEDDSLETLVPSLRSIPLSFPFLMRFPVFIHLGRERKAFSPVASLSGKLRKHLHDQPEGRKCFCADTSWCRGFSQKHVHVPACFCWFHRQDKDVRLWERQPCAFSVGAVPGENYSPGFPSKATALYLWACYLLCRLTECHSSCPW